VSDVSVGSTPGAGRGAAAESSSVQVRKLPIRLSDGRELIYFDDREPYPSRTETDNRGLERPDTHSEIRLDVLTGEYVAMAAHRMDRTYLPPANENPLAPTRPGEPPTEIPAPDYDVVVFENRFPAFSGGTGRCEVVCFTSDPSASFATLSERRARTVIEAWADRTEALSALPGTRQVVCFENRGEEIGVTLTHPHGQIYAYPYLPARTQSLLRQAGAHRAATGGSLLADVLADEQRADVRMVLRGEQWSAYVPLAAKWPLELILAPHRDVRDLAELTGDERAELAVVYLDLLRRVDRFFPGVDRTPYISAWHQAPVGEDRELGRLHLQLFSVMRAPGRLKFLAGSESALGAWINDTTPERIARRLREVAES
jgi:UDPglucose--hexose-1-phosphate uridylyltransferase